MTQQWPDWRGCTVIIVASGPSAANVDLELARGRAKFIAINESWRLAPWSDILYACDGDWWRKHGGLPEFAGYRLTEDKRAADEFGLGRVTVCQTDRYIQGAIGTVGSGGNSGFQALNLAIQFGATNIALVGYDMTLANGEHWHGRHQGLNNPRPHNISRWCAARWPILDHVSIFNCSPVSALTAYPKVELTEWLNTQSRG